MKYNNLKRFCVDMIALNLFIICTAFIVEVIISGIDIIVFLKGRLIMITPNIVTVEPYNQLRIYLNNKLFEIKNQRMRLFLRDTITFLIFRVPLVFIVLFLLDVEYSKIISACIAATAISGFTGRPYGIFLDFMRKMFKVG